MTRMKARNRRRQYPPAKAFRHRQAHLSVQAVPFALHIDDGGHSRALDAFRMAEQGRTMFSESPFRPGLLEQLRIERL